MILKRILAYFVDCMIVGFLVTFVFSLLPFENKMEEYQNSLNGYVEMIMGSGSSDPDEKELNDLLYDTYKAQIPYLILRIGLMFVYFGVFAFLMKGQTLGKKIFKLKIVSENGGNLNPALFVLRSILVINFIPELLLILLLLLASKDVWLSLSSYINSLSSIMMFLLVGFVLFRDDKRGLHDLIAKTKVVSVEENV